MKSSSMRSGVGSKWTLLSLFWKEKDKGVRTVLHLRGKKVERLDSVSIRCKPTRDEIERYAFTGHTHEDAWSKRLDEHGDV